MRTTIWAAAALAACAAPDPSPDARTVEVAGVAYGVRAVANEPQPLSGLDPLPGGAVAVGPDAAFGAPGPAVRVSGAVSRPPAAEAMRQFCEDRGVIPPQGAPVRFDDATADHVFYVEC
jgi:hypothetical protein